MGSFNVGCGISGLAIEEGDKIGFVILNKSDGTLDRLSEGVGFTSFMREADLFKPFLPPVFGVYGDYGVVENITESKTTEVLENMFGLKVQDVIACLSCNRDVYSSMSKIFELYFKGSKTFQDFGADIATSLVELGFVEAPAGKQSLAKIVAKKNEQVFTLGDYELVLRPNPKPYPESLLPFWSVRESATGNVLIEEFQSQFISEALNSFAKATGIFPGYDSADVEKISVLNGFYGMFFLKKAFTGMRKHLVKNDYYYPSARKSYRDAWDQFAKVMNLKLSMNGNDKFTKDELSKMIPLLDMPQSVERNTSFPMGKLDALAGYGCDYEYLEIFDLMDVLASVNRMFQPSFCGSQDGDTDSSLALNAINDSVLARRKARNDEYDD